MPHAEPTPITPPAHVVVTGANGFIASHAIDQLLRLGFRVTGTVRSQSKADSVLRTHAALNPSAVGAGLLSTVVVPDITDPEAYTSLFATTRPVAVLHLASPFGYTLAPADFEREMMQPAVAGTEAVLKAAAQPGSSVRRVVQTNSFAGIYDAALGPRPGYTYTARDWCPLMYEDGVRAAAAPVAYRASKTVAERTAWEFIKTNNNTNDSSPSLPFDLVSLCPAMVFGPFLDTAHSLPASPAELNTSNKLVWDVVSAGADAAVPPTKGPVWVDVRDVAAAHVTALTDAAMGGQRLLLARGVYCTQEIADVARRVAAKHAHRIPLGQPGRREAEAHFAVDSSREEALLRLKWRGLDETLADLLPQLYRIEKAASATKTNANDGLVDAQL